MMSHIVESCPIMAAYPSCTLRMKMLFRDRQIMVHDMHMRLRKREIAVVVINNYYNYCYYVITVIITNPFIRLITITE